MTEVLKINFLRRQNYKDITPSFFPSNYALQETILEFIV